MILREMLPEADSSSAGIGQRAKGGEKAIELKDSSRVCF
jgi:hypothetical protein